MMKKVLVAHASKHGTIDKMAHIIMTVLLFRRIKVEILDVVDVHDISAYDTIILGSAAYDEEWLSSAEAFLNQCATELALKNVWLFSGGMKYSAVPDNLRSTIQQIQPINVAAFGDMSNLATMTIDTTIRGGFREWNTVTQWADDIIESLQASQPPASQS